MPRIFRLSVRRQAKPWPKWKRNGNATAFYWAFEKIENDRISSRAGFRVSGISTVGKNLDPSHPFGMTTLFPGILTQCPRRGREIGSSSPPLRGRTKDGVLFWCLNPELGTRNYAFSFCVHQETMDPMWQVAPALRRQDSKYSWIFGSSSSYSICVPPSLTLVSIGLSSPRATKL